MIHSGDLVIFTSYIPDGDGYQANGMDSKQPCLFIARRKHGRISNNDNRAWGIPLSDAYRYTQSNGYPTPYLFQVTSHIGHYIGLGDGYTVRKQIWEAICNYIPDMVEGAKNFDMVRDERHGPGREEGEVKVYNHGDLVAHRAMIR